MNKVPGLKVIDRLARTGIYPTAVGMAIAGKIDKILVECAALTGDEERELQGIVWEAAMQAAHKETRQLGCNR